MMYSTSMNESPEHRDSLDEFLLLRRPTGWQVISKIPRSAYCVLCTRNGLRSLSTSLYAILRSPLSVDENLLQAVDVKKALFPHLSRSFRDVTALLTVASIAVYLYCSLTHRDSIGWVVFYTVTALLSECLKTNCYVTLVALLQEDRDALIQSYLLQNEGICLEHEDAVTDDDDDDDDDGSYTYTSWTESMTSCSSFVDDSSFWDCRDNGCGTDLLESWEDIQSCCTEETAMVFENLEIVGQSTS